LISGENEFKGFPARMQYTPVPNIVFSAVLPQIKDLVELKILLHVLALLYTRKGALKTFSLAELLNDPGLAVDLDSTADDARTETTRALDGLAAKNILLHIALERSGKRRDYYCLNTEANQAAIEKIRSGETALPESEFTEVIPLREPPADIFSLYEQNVGIITPLIAEELKDANIHYPAEWIRDAIKEAVNLNKRNWRYIARILEKWSTEGKESGTHRGNLKKDTDPDKYIRGKYGHMVQR
jgi:DNA replication protein